MPRNLRRVLSIRVRFCPSIQFLARTIIRPLPLSEIITDIKVCAVSYGIAEKLEMVFCRLYIQVSRFLTSGDGFGVAFRMGCF
jgi:hypothetical protein